MADDKDSQEPVDPLTVGELRPLKELAEEFGMSYNSLRGYAMRGRLRAVKFGNQWAATHRAVEEYLASRSLENIPHKYRKGLDK